MARRTPKADPLVEADFLNIVPSERPLRPQGGFKNVFQHGEKES